MVPLAVPLMEPVGAANGTRSDAVGIQTRGLTDGETQPASVEAPVSAVSLSRYHCRA